MKDFGLPVSAFVHVAFLAAAVFALPSVKTLEPPPEDSLPVEILTPEQFSAITKGEKTAKPAEKPQAKVEKVQPTIKPPEEDPAKEIARESVATPQPPAPKPEPKPEPPKPEPKPEPKPAPPKPSAEDAQKLDELALRASQQPDPPKPEKKPDPPKKSDPPKKPETAKAQEKPAPKPAEKSEATREFDPSKVAALLSREKPTRAAKTGDAESQTAALGSTRGTAPKLSLSQRNAIVGAVMQHVSPCWSPPSFAADAKSLAVVIAVDLDAQGVLAGEPDVVSYPAGPSGSAAASAALRALKRCITAQSPLKLPPELYGSWRALEINFDPRDMAGG